MLSMAYRQPSGNHRTAWEIFSSFIGPNKLFVRMIVLLVGLRAEASALQ
jgi:hypothetical protein